MAVARTLSRRVVPDRALHAFRRCFPAFTRRVLVLPRIELNTLLVERARNQLIANPARYLDTLQERHDRG